MSSIASPTMAEMPMAAQIGTRSGIRASSTTIISAVAMPLLQHEQGLRVGREAAGDLPVEINQLGDRDIERGDQQRQHKQVLGPVQHGGFEHSEKPERLDREPRNHAMKPDRDEAREDIDPTSPRLRHELHGEVDANVLFVL